MDIKTLEKALVDRLDKFRARDGSDGQARPDGQDWTPAEWLQAVIAELGEYANERRAFDLREIPAWKFRETGGAELADVVMFVILLAWTQGIDLDSAIVQKFNEVNSRLGIDPLEVE